MKFYSMICVNCDSRWGIGDGNMQISMCEKCIKNHKERNKVRDYSGFEEAAEIVYSRVRLRVAPPIRTKSILDYLR